MTSDSGFDGAPFRPRTARSTAPEPAPHYVRRASLLREVDAVLERRLTVLRAPAGFGKTTVLADVSRRRERDGVAVGWLSLDERDSPGVLGAGIARTLERAGLDVTAPRELDVRSASPVAAWVAMLAGAVERQAAACLLALDDLDRLPDRSVALVDRLVTRGPANLHVAVTFRSAPRFEFATHVLNGTARFVGAERFRFSKPEIARFFRGKLSRREVTAVHARTLGWPVALMLCRSVGVGEARGARAVDAKLSWGVVEAQLLRNVPAGVRADLLDLAVFERIDADLVDEVLGSSDARLRVLARPELEGLLLPVDDDGTVRCLHPLVKEYCVDRLWAEDPIRMRSLHARIARVPSGRGA